MPSADTEREHRVVGRLLTEMNLGVPNHVATMVRDLRPRVPEGASPRALAGSNRVTLWPLANYHIEPLQRLLADEDVRATWRTRGAFWAPFQVQAQLARDVLVSSVVTLGAAPDDPIVGLVEILDPAFVDRRAQLSVVVGRRYLSTGVGVEATLLFLEFVFEAYPIDKICIEVQARNLRLTPGLHRLLTHEGTFLRHMNILGEWVDLSVFALFREDFPRLNVRLRSRIRSEVCSDLRH